jgi:GTP-binding protein
MPKSTPLFLQPCHFVMGCVSLETMPPPRLPEIAFAGRSNVGKSSLINALTGRRKLVKASVTPGRTREINFFLLAEKLMLVDLPGYGYAKASKKDVARWTKLVRDYLTDRPNLRRIALMIDARHGVKPIDEEVMSMLDEAGAIYQIVLTKSDKISASELHEVTQRTQSLTERHPALHPRIMPTSAHDRDGIDALRAELGGVFSRKA